MKSFVFGNSSQSLPILAHEFGSASGAHALVLGGVHGDEREGWIAANGLLDKLSNQSTFPVRVTLIPAFNIDGVIRFTRVNGRGVDLNRNLPTKDWDPKAFNDRYPPGPEPCSEPENRALVSFIEKEKPDFVLSLHSFEKFLLNVNGDCEPQASILHQATGYPIEPSMGYPTPGCLGTYTGLERGIPTITYELERGIRTEAILQTHVPAILEALKSTTTQRKEV